MVAAWEQDNAEQYGLREVEEPNTNDVLCGRGIPTNNWPGNVQYREMLTPLKDKYLLSTKALKISISKGIVEAVRSMNPPGRFLEKDATTGRWVDIGDTRAQAKTSQTLRNGAVKRRKELAESSVQDEDEFSEMMGFTVTYAVEVGEPKARPTKKRKGSPQSSSAPSPMGNASSLQQSCGPAVNKSYFQGSDKPSPWLSVQLPQTSDCQTPHIVSPLPGSRQQHPGEASIYCCGKWFFIPTKPRTGYQPPTGFRTYQQPPTGFRMPGSPQQHPAGFTNDALAQQTPAGGPGGTSPQQNPTGFTNFPQPTVPSPPSWQPADALATNPLAQHTEPSRGPREASPQQYPTGFTNFPHPTVPWAPPSWQPADARATNPLAQHTEPSRGPGGASPQQYPTGFTNFPQPIVPWAPPSWQPADARATNPLAQHTEPSRVSLT